MDEKVIDEGQSVNGMDLQEFGSLFILLLKGSKVIWLTVSVLLRIARSDADGRPFRIHSDPGQTVSYISSMGASLYAFPTEETLLYCLIHYSSIYTTTFNLGRSQPGFNPLSFALY